MAVYWCIFLPNKRRDEIFGDISTGCIGTILSVKDNWMEIADDKGRKKRINAYDGASIREYPKKG